MQPEIYNSLAYSYDGTLEGLLTACFEAYARHECPEDIAPQDVLQPRLGQRISSIATSIDKATRVRNGLIRRGGWSAFNAVRKASCSSQPDAGTAAYRFVRYAMDKYKGKQAPFSNISHPDVQPLFAITRSINQECEHMRQFIRFEHLEVDESSVWFAKCNPRDSVIPLIMQHFVERFNVQPFIIFDEAHHVSGIYNGNNWWLIRGEAGKPDISQANPASEEMQIQEAWKRFYRSVSIDARYNPELRRQFMPKRFWRNITEIENNLSNSLQPSHSSHRCFLNS